MYSLKLNAESVVSKVFNVKSGIQMPFDILNKSSTSVTLPFKEKIDLTKLGVSEVKKTAFLVKNLLSEEECLEIINLTESIGYVQAGVNYGPNVEAIMTSYRNGERLMIDDFEFAKILCQRLEPFIQKKQYGCDLECINERFKFLKYEQGGFFRKHEDSNYSRPDNSSTSFFTVQIYLNSVDEGGATNFIHPDDENVIIPILPQPGMALIFQHDMLHEGAEVIKGEKYTIKTEIMYKII